MAKGKAISKRMKRLSGSIPLGKQLDDTMWNSVWPGAFTSMAKLRTMTGKTESFPRPMIVAAIVAVLSIVTMGIVNHTDLVVNHQPPLTPPGTTFHAVKDSGAQISPTVPPSPLDPPRIGQLPSEQSKPD